MITKEEYEFIKFLNNSRSFGRNPDGILVLRHYGLRKGKRLMRSLVKKGVLEWNEQDSEDGIYAPVRYGFNYGKAVKEYIYE